MSYLIYQFSVAESSFLLPACRLPLVCFLKGKTAGTVDAWDQSELMSVSNSQAATNLTHVSALPVGLFSSPVTMRARMRVEALCSSKSTLRLWYFAVYPGFFFQHCLKLYLVFLMSRCFGSNFVYRLITSRSFVASVMNTTGSNSAWRLMYIALRSVLLKMWNNEISYEFYQQQKIVWGKGTN